MPFFPGAAMDEEQIQPEQFEEIARALVPQTLRLVKDSGFIPPLEILVTDADHHVICGVYMGAHYGFKDLSDKERVLRGRFPGNVTVTDKNGKTWTRVFTPMDLPSSD
jgi:hypothetical protein